MTQPPPSCSCACPSHHFPSRSSTHNHNNQGKKRKYPAPSAFTVALRDIQTADLSNTEKAKAIQQLYATRRKEFLAQSTNEKGVFPGKGARKGCQHYKRNCWLKAACCGKFYPCRRCHDEAEDHEINRHDTKQVACVECGLIQDVSSHCKQCGIQFARYFCKHCVFYDDEPGKHIYHCNGCGICRVGKGLGIDYHHCERCETCVPIAVKHSHPCRNQSLDVNCPICREYLRTSTEPVVFMRCGHAIHKECFRQHTKQAYTCPLCKKSLTDMTEYFQQLDQRIAKEVLPKEYRNKQTRILCRDCDTKSIVSFHFVHHKCLSCSSYNTQVLQYLSSSSPSTTRTNTQELSTTATTTTTTTTTI